MKKQLLAASLLCMSVTASFAQMPDASKWQVGDEITSEVGWGNLSFENEPMDYWQLKSSKGSFTQTGGLFEVYDGADVDLYQYVQLPAGMYKVECQAYYRCGTSWDDDPNSFGDPNRWENNALLQVSNGQYDIDSDEFTAGRTFKTPLMPRLFLNYPNQIYVMPSEDDPGWDMSDGDYGAKGWGPTSVPGSLAWFNEGLYQPYNEDGVKYNTVTFFLTEDGYAKVGITKVNPRSADSFMATNFKMYYMGEAGEAAELMALQDEVAEYYHMIEDLEASYDGGMIYTLISDARMEFDGEYGSIDSMDKETCLAAIEELKAIYNNATAAAEYVVKLEDVIKVMELLYNNTDYAGKAAFGVALQSAQNCLDPDYMITDEDDFDTFQKTYDELLAARITYLMTQEAENGAYNFSAVINTPFFCDNEFTPVWSAEANAYVFPNIEDVADELQPENTWATVQENGYSELIDPSNGNYKEGWIHISDNVKISERDGENQWVIKSTTWHGGGPIGVTMQHGYPAVGGWTAEPTGNPELLYQTITGLPNGYYAMSGLMCNAGADVSELQYVYIEAGDKKEIANLTQKGDPWWWGDKNMWRSTVWEKLTTNMVYVSDGKVTIGSASDAFYAATGFQLYYYGEDPDFTALLAPSINGAKANIEALAWKGDKAAANALLAQVPAKIEGQEAYQSALAVIAQVNAYVATANAVTTNYTNTINNFQALLEKQADGSAEANIVTTAWMAAVVLGDGDNDTYLDAIAMGNDYNAYVAYLDYRASMGELIKDAAVAEIIAEQNAYLIANFANAEKLAELKAALAAPYNKALLASLGMDKASEENPVDVTALIINPDFSAEGKGWNGEMTVDSLGTVERWNCNFDINQTIYALPAGCYQVQVQALYRDAGDAGTAYNNWWYMAAADIEYWDNPNAKLYANTAVKSVVSIASEMFTDQSYTSYVDRWQVAEEGDDEGNEVWEPVWVHQADAEEGKENDYPWDTKVEDLGDIYYYPASLRGVSRRFGKSPNAYINKVETMVEEGGSLTIGIKKDILINSDWCAFDNWKLFYLGTTASTGIGSVETATGTATEYYSVSGARLAAPQKGINIVKYNDGTVKKVMMK